MTKWFAAAGFLVSLGAGFAGVQGQVLHPDGTAPAFEAATIKPWKPSQPPPSSAPSASGAPSPKPIVKFAPVGVPPQTTDRVHFIGQAALLIASAYNIPVAAMDRIVGGPQWIYSQDERYEVLGRIDDAQFAAMQKMTAPQQHEQVQRMEQSLLAERFGLKVHIESRDMPVYAMVVSKNGSRMTPAENGEASRLFTTPGEDGNIMTARGVTMEDLASSPLMWAGKRQVVNQTGLAGRFDFDLKWTGGMGPAQDGDAPSLFTAMQEQLGLKLVPVKAPLEIVVIDRIERPTAN